MRNAINTPTRRVLLEGSSLTAFLAIGHTMIDTFASMPSALLPILQDRFGLTETTLSFVVATLSFSTSVVQPLLGSLSDRYGVRVVGAISIILNTALLSLIGVASSLPILFALLFIGGLGSAAFHPAGSSLARSASSHRKGLAVSLFGAGGTLGLALGPVVILSVVSAFGLEATPWLMIPGILLGVLTYLLVPATEPAAHGDHHTLFNTRLIVGPVGLLCLVGILSSIAFVTFSSAIALWLVAQGVARDSPLIGWTLSTFSLSAAVGGILAGALSSRFSIRLLISGSMALAVVPLLAIFMVEPGTPLFFLVVMLAGGLGNASLPLLIVSAQDLAPDAIATASGMLLGFATGTAGVLYIGIGQLQDLIGLAPAMRLSFLALIPAAMLAWYVLSRYRPPTDEPTPTDTARRAVELGTTCLCSACACAQSRNVGTGTPVPPAAR